MCCPHAFAYAHAQPMMMPMPCMRMECPTSRTPLSRPHASCCLLSINSRWLLVVSLRAFLT